MGLIKNPFFREVAAPVSLLTMMPLMLKELRDANLKNHGQLNYTNVAQILVGVGLAVHVAAALTWLYKLVRGRGDVVSDVALAASAAFFAYLALATKPLGFVDPFFVPKANHAMLSRAVEVSDPKVATAWALAVGFLAFQMFLISVVPGPVFKGPVSPTGQQPLYRDNGLSVHLITMALFYFASVHLEWFDASIAYDHFDELGDVLNLSALVVCALLWVKGHVAPTSTDNHYTGNPVHEFYAGIELYPTVFGFQIKQLSNVCFGMGGWPVLIASFAAAQEKKYGHLADSMVVCLLLQQVYIAKFFYWVASYMASIDIHTDHAGFYLIWGCLCFLPTLYTNSTLYLVDHPVELGPWMATAQLVGGLLCVYINYIIDAQRAEVRATRAQKPLGFGPDWGQMPKVLMASYTTTKGEHKVNELLVNGWWGVSRHLHYIPELGAAFLWCCNGGFHHVTPYLYFIFLVILLTDRAVRDEVRLQDKYGKDFQAYCRIVKYRIIPGVY